MAARLNVAATLLQSRSTWNNKAQKLASQYQYALRFYPQILTQVVQPVLLSTLNAAADAGAWSNFAGACLQSALAACYLLSAVSKAPKA